MKYFARLFDTKGLPCHFYFLGQPGIVVSSPRWIFILSLLVSLMPSRWKNYFKASQQKSLENFTYTAVDQAVPTDVLRKGVKLFFKFNVSWLLSPGFRILRPLSLFMIASNFLSCETYLIFCCPLSYRGLKMYC